MIIDEIIPLLPIIGFSLVFLKICSKLKIKLSLPEKIIYSIVIFSSILVIPWTIFGMQKFTIGFQLWPIFWGLFGMLALGILIYQNYKYIIPWLENPVLNTKNLFNKIGGISSTNSIILLTIALLLIGFTIFNLVLPFRDFDAIWMYIPDAMWYYRSNYIPQFNPLNFRLSTKEPFISLLFTFSLYVTGTLSIKLIPILFIIGWSLTVFVFIDKIWHDLTKSLMGVLLFLVSPFMYYILNFWVYYQEIYVSFFYSVTLLAIFSFFKIEKSMDLTNKKRMETFYLLFGSLSFALSLLSKLSGWSLLILILLMYPFSKKSKILQTTILFLLAIFLFFKASVDYYIGIGIAIILFFLLMISLLWKPLTSQESSIYSVKKTSWIGLLIIPLGLIGGGFWLVDTFNKFHQYSTTIIDLYVVINNLKIQYIFHGTPFHSSRFLLESAHSVDFISIVGYLLVGNMLVLFWLVPKIRVIFDDQVKFFILWILGFFVLWLTYQSFASIRYLSVILVPVIIVVTHGFHKLYQDVSKNKGPIPLRLVFLASFLSFTSYYFPLSPAIFSNGISTKTINNQFLLSAFNYYKNSIFYLLFALVVSILFILWFKYDLTKYFSLKIHNRLYLRSFKALMLSLIVFIPFLVPSGVFLSVNGNVNQFNSTFVYYQRPAYTEVVNTLLNENSPSSGIIVVNFPGLPIYLNQPTLDLFNEAGSLKSAFPSNITNLLKMLQQPLTYIKSNYNISVSPNQLPASFSFDYFVIPNYANNYYPFYESGMYNQTYLFPLLFQKSLFQLIYENNEFLVFKRIYVIPSFSGIVNSYLVSKNTNSSVLGRIQNSFQTSENLNLQLLCSIPEAQKSQLTINSTINLYEKNSLIAYNSVNNLTLSGLNSFFTVTIPLTNILPQAESFSIANLTLRILITNNKSFITRTYGLSSQEGQITINYNSIDKEWSMNTGIGLQPF